MSNHKRNFTIESQKRVGFGDAGWIMCPPGEAERFVLVELTIWHQRKPGGFKRQFRKRRILEVFEGENMEATASTALAEALRRKG